MALALEKVILETKTESGQVLRISQLYDDKGDENGFVVYRGEYKGSEGRFRELGKWLRLDKALQHYNDALARLMGVK